MSDPTAICIHNNFRGMCMHCSPRLDEVIASKDAEIKRLKEVLKDEKDAVRLLREGVEHWRREADRWEKMLNTQYTIAHEQRQDLASKDAQIAAQRRALEGVMREFLAEVSDTGVYCSRLLTSSEQDAIRAAKEALSLSPERAGGEMEKKVDLALFDAANRARNFILSKCRCERGMGPSCMEGCGCPHHGIEAHILEKLSTRKGGPDAR